MYRTLLKQRMDNGADVMRAVVIEFTHSQKIKTRFGSRPGTICEVYEDRPGTDLTKGWRDRLVHILTQTTLLQGKYISKFNKVSRSMTRVWKGDNFSRNNGRQISIGLAGKVLGAGHDERKRLQRMVAGTSPRQRRRRSA